MIANRQGFLSSIDVDRVNIDISKASINVQLNSVNEDLKDYRKSYKFLLYFLMLRQKMYYKWKLRMLSKERKKLDRLYFLANKRLK